jgi:hypothetical protein
MEKERESAPAKPGFLSPAGLLEVAFQHMLSPRHVIASLNSGSSPFRELLKLTLEDSATFAKAGSTSTALTMPVTMSRVHHMIRPNHSSAKKSRTGAPGLAPCPALDGYLSHMSWTHTRF